jgi:hypothetical protein
MFNSCSFVNITTTAATFTARGHLPTVREMKWLTHKDIYISK